MKKLLPIAGAAAVITAIIGAIAAYRSRRKSAGKSAICAAVEV